MSEHERQPPTPRQSHAKTPYIRNRRKNTPVPEVHDEPEAGLRRRVVHKAGRLRDRVALITGADSGIMVEPSQWRWPERARTAIAYLNEHEDAEKTREVVERADRQAALLPGDLSDPQYCTDVVTQTVEKFGR